MTISDASDNFTSEERQALYKIILERRDIRSFKKVPIPDDALGRKYKQRIKDRQLGLCNHGIS